MLIISRGCVSIIRKYYSLLFIVILILSLIPSTFAEQRIEYNLTYDANGNLIQGFNEYYEYNGFNQLDKVRENNATGRILSEYSYDHEGNRLKKIKYNIGGTNETTYYWDKEFVQVVNSSGTYNFTYYYHDDTLIAEEDQLGNKLFYHPDHLGSTTLITNDSGSVVEYVSYLPYGELLGSSDKRFLFTGKEKDPESNLYYYGARYYDPFFSHFTQADQNILNIYDPQDLNRYSYVRNNPYKYVDPSGNYIETFIDIAFIVSDIAILINDPSTDNTIALGLDVVGVAVPFVAGAGKAYKIGKTLSKAEDVAKVSEKTKVVSKSINEIKEISQVEKKIPNPFGKKGSLEHQERIKDVAKYVEKNLKGEIISGGGSQERRIEIGIGKYRYPDIQAKINGKDVFINVGKTKASGEPVSREIQALEDLRKRGTTVFVPYDKPFVGLRGGE